MTFSEEDIDKLICEFSRSHGFAFSEKVLESLVTHLTENLNIMLEEKEKECGPN